MSSERQKYLPWILIAAFLVSAATLSFSRSSNIGLRHDRDGKVILEWPADTGTLYAVYWTANLMDRWHLLDEVSAETSAVALADMEGVDRPAVSNSNVQGRYYAVRKVVPTPVSSDVTTGTVWTLMASPYVLTNQVCVRAGAILTIEPGVVVRAEGGGTLVVSNGGLRALGTTNEAITFTGVPLVFEDYALDANCVLSNAAIEGAGIICRSSSPTIVHCSIQGSDGCGIVLQGSSPLISDCGISNHAGGGISCDASSPTIRTCRITFNFDSGIVCRNGSVPLILRCQLDQNIAESVGGGLYSELSSPTIQDCVFAENCAVYGAGLYLRNSSASITTCTITSNGIGGYYCHGTSKGGGLYCEASGPEITGCIFSENRAGDHGAGLFIDEDSGPVLRNCSIRMNRSYFRGGGMYCMSSNMVAENCLIAANEGLAGGGAIYSESSGSVLRNCTIVGNLVHGLTGSALFLQNCIVWGNPGVQIDSGTELHHCIVQEDYPFGNLNDPKFIPGSYRLNSGSPCIDAGDPTDAPSVDIEGFVRRSDPFCTNGFSAIDIGAYEYVDSDVDRLADFWEMQVFSNLSHDATSDLDEDGLTDVEEIEAGTSLDVADTDGDGLLDGDEVKSKGTNPLNRDTDSDGYTDDDEVARGSDPRNGRDIPYVSHVVINEVMYYATNRNTWRTQFVELFNSCDHDVNLQGWTLVVSQYGRTQTPITFDEPVIMGPASYYLIGGPFLSSVDGHLPDMIADPGLKPLKNGNGSVVDVRLLDASGELVDGLLYGSLELGHIADDFPVACAFPPHPTVPRGWSISRIVDGQDRNRASDWCALENPTPKGAGNSELFYPEDLDRDGLSLWRELILDTDPEDADTDGDGLLDGDEVTRGTDPASFDSDGDGIHDDREISMGTNPAAKDTDGDGLWDSTEQAFGSDACNPDSDGDGTLDGAEDSNADGITDEGDQAVGSIPRRSIRRRLSGPVTGWLNDGRVTWDMACEDKKVGKYFVQDYYRETTFHFYNVSAPAVVFIPLRVPAKWSQSFSVSGAQLFRNTGTLRVYATQVPVSGKTVRIREYLAGRTWPEIRYLDPAIFDVTMDGVAPPDQESPGAIVLLNDDDDDLDGTNDFEDAHVPAPYREVELGDYEPRGDDDLIPIRVSHPLETPIWIDWDDSIVHLYDHPSKKFRDRTGRGWIWNAAVGACLRNKAYKGYDNQVIYLEGVKPGFTWVTVHCGSYQKRIRVAVVKAKLAADFNHDRKIDANDTTLAVSNAPFRFWINDDDDRTADSGDDIPGGTSHPDKENFNVDSVRDLVDFFPVYLDMTNVLEFVDETNFTYKLSHGEGLLNYIRTDMTPMTAGDYLTDVGTAESVVTQSVQCITGMPGSAPLDPAFLRAIKRDGRGVVLLEAKDRTREPLELNMYDHYGRCVAQWKLPLSISGVEEMYRFINLRRAVGIEDGATNRLYEPPNYPDALTISKNFIFVHGYACNSEQARGWLSEIYKRMFWSGSKAKFYGVTWYGNESQTWKWIPCLGDKTPNYHVNVMHAFQAASNLAEYVTPLSGYKYLAAHSLGAGVASSAIEDYGLTVDQCYLIDGAMAAEAYDTDPGLHSIHMVHSEWDSYTNQTRLYCANWHKLFTNDDRSRLTWEGRFSNVANVAYNFYSSGEEVLRLHDHSDDPGLLDVGMFSNEGEYAWALQEKLKGRMWVNGIGGSTYGGWGFNNIYNGVDATTLCDDELKNDPFFRKGVGEIDSLYSAAPSIASDYARRKREYLLAGFIPALTLPIGANEVPKFSVPGGSARNFDMNTLFQTGWPTERATHGWGRRWLHSDLRVISYPYVHLLFDKFVSEGGLDHQ